VLVNPQTATSGKSEVPGSAGAGRAKHVDIRVHTVLPEELKERSTRVRRYGLSNRDYERLAAIPTVERAVPTRRFFADVRRLEHADYVQVVATRPDYFSLSNTTLAAGRFLVEEDGEAKRTVAVLGANVAQKLFPLHDPLEHTVRLGNDVYEVVGVLRPRDPVRDGKKVEIFDSDIYIPQQTCQARFGSRVVVRKPGAFIAEEVQVSEILLALRDRTQLRQTTALIASILQHEHPQKDWGIQPPGGR
jgi:putative ABC transport system permease protein